MLTEDRMMNRLIVIAALALGTAVTQQAIACDFQREANTTPVIVAEGCGGANCVTEQPTTSESVASAAKGTHGHG